jgi:hypothetical protein
MFKNVLVFLVFYLANVSRMAEPQIDSLSMLSDEFGLSEYLENCFTDEYHIHKWDLILP